MFKLTRRSNLIPFILIFILGVAASIAAQIYLPDFKFEIPVFALFPGEIALSIFISVFLFENASPPQLLKIAFLIIFMSFLAGVGCNLSQHGCVMLPEQNVLVNWVQLLAINMTGALSTLLFFRTEAEAEVELTTRRPASGRAPVAKEVAHPQEAALAEAEADDSLPVAEISKTESAKEILDKLDTSRIDELEQSLHSGNASDKVSLESLFAEDGRSGKNAGRPGSNRSVERVSGEYQHPSGPPPLPDSPKLREILGSNAAQEQEPAPAVSLDFSFLGSPEPLPLPAASSSFLDEQPSAPPATESSLAEFTLPEPVAPPAPAPAAAQVETAAAKNTLFDDVSDDLDNLFNDLTMPGAQKDFSPQDKLPDLSSLAGSVSAEPVSGGDAGGSESVHSPVNPGSLPSGNPDGMDLAAWTAAELSFDDLAFPGPKVDPASGKSAAAEAVKEFGKLSAAAVQPEPVSSGTLKTIGQMLLDTQAVERLIKSADKEDFHSARARVLTVDRGADLQNLMDRVSSYPGIESCLLIGKDGLLLSNSESCGPMKYVLGPISLAILSTTNLGTSKLQMGQLRQAVLCADDKISILTDVGSGILAVFSKGDASHIDSTVAFIAETLSNDSSVQDLPVAAMGNILKEPVASSSQPGVAAASPLSPPAPAPAEQIAAPNVVPSPPLVPPMPAAPLGGETTPAASAPAPLGSSASQQSSGSGLLNVSDDDISGLFDSLLGEPEVANKNIASSAERSTVAPQITPAPLPMPESAPPAASSTAQQADGLLNVSDSDLSGLFDSLLSEASPDKQAGSAAAAQSAPVAPPVSPASPLSPESPAPSAIDFSPSSPAAGAVPPAESSSTGKIKEFGKLSASAMKVDSGSEQGAMKSIGKQLLDVQAVENIIKAGETRQRIGSGLTTARVISAARGEGIKTLLSKIDTYEGVVGSLIVGHDGLVIASTLAPELDKDTLGALSTAMYSHLGIATDKLERGKLGQVLFRTQGDKLTVLTSVAVGILAVFADHTKTEEVDGLLKAIEVTVRG